MDDEAPGLGGEPDFRSHCAGLSDPRQAPGVFHPPDEGLLFDSVRGHMRG